LVTEIDLRRGLSVEIEDLVRRKDQWSAQLQQPVIGKCLDDQLCSDPIQIADGNPYHGSLLLNAHALILCLSAQKYDF
jgi:hypothetical protein